MTLQDDYSNNLAKAIALAGLNNKELGKKSGVSPSRISYLVRNLEKTNPSLEVVEKLARALKIPAWQMLVPPAEFSANKAEDLSSLCGRYTKLSEASRAKVMIYISDLIDAEQT